MCVEKVRILITIHFPFLLLNFVFKAFSPSFESNPPVDCLNGKVVEANGMWLTAIKAAVALVQPRSHHSKQLFLDFEHAGGYYVLLSLLKGSTVGFFWCSNTHSPQHH